MTWQNRKTIFIQTDNTEEVKCVKKVLPSLSVSSIIISVNGYLMRKAGVGFGNQPKWPKSL